MNDLFFSVKINDAAKKLGLTAVFVQERTAALEQLNSGPAAVILDLNCASLDPLELIRTIREDSATSGIATIGFISHVQTELRRKAEESGCDTVVARSVFARDLPAILERSIYTLPVPAAETS